MKKSVVAIAGLMLLSSIGYGGDINELLIGGRVAKVGDFPEVVYINVGNARCSATIVGPMVIMTAAHCVKDGGQIKPASFTFGQTVFHGVCKQSPLYKGNVDADVALCKLDKPIETVYATIANHGPELGKEVTLSGYGCTQPGGGGGNDGFLRYGEAFVEDVSDSEMAWQAMGGAALCFGDSGGPAFLRLKEPAKEKHYVIGVNSRGDIKQLSLLTSMWVPQAKKFLTDFAQSEGVEICGINRECGLEGPRPEPGPDDPKPEPEPPLPPEPPKPDPKPHPKCKHEAKKLAHYKAKVEKWQKKYDQCSAKRSTLPFIEEE